MCAAVTTQGDGLEMEMNEQAYEEVAVKLFDQSRRRLMFYRFLVIAVGAFIIFLIMGEAFRKTASDTHALPLLVCYVFFALGMLMGRSAGEYMRMHRAWEHSPETMRDYCALQYHRTKKKAAKSNMLFLMAKSDLYAGRLAQAAETLNRVEYYGISQIYQATYHFLWALIHRLDGNQEEFARNVDIYRQMAEAQGKKLPRGQERLAILMEGNEQRMREAVDLGEDLSLSKKKCFWNGILGFTLFFLLLIVIGKELLPAGYEFRNWFLILCCAFFQVLALVSGVMSLIRANAVRRKIGKTGIGSKIIGVIGLVILLLLFLVNDVMGTIFMNSEECLPDGNILVEYHHFLDSPDYWVYEPWGLVFRRCLYQTDSPHAGEGETEISEKNSTVMEVVDDQRKQWAYEAIYESQLSDFPGGLTLQVSAKGELYALAGDVYEAQYLDQTVTARRTTARHTKAGLRIFTLW